MGRQRTINDQAFWRSPKLAACSTEDKVVLFHSLTSPDSNVVGCYELVPRIAAAEIGWSAEQWMSVVDRLEQQNLIAYDREKQFIWSGIWWDHHSAPQSCGQKLIGKTVRELAKVPNQWHERYFPDYYKRIGPRQSKLVAAEAIFQDCVGEIPYLYDIDTYQTAACTNTNNKLLNKTETQTSISVDLSRIPQGLQNEVKRALVDCCQKGDLSHDAQDVVDELARLYQKGGEQRPRSAYAFTTHLAKCLDTGELMRERDNKRFSEFENSEKREYYGRFYAEPAENPKKCYRILDSGFFDQLEWVRGKLERRCGRVSFDFVEKIKKGLIVEIDSSTYECFESTLAQPSCADA